MTAVVVIGSGFAGLWAALGAARRLDELAAPVGSVEITVLSAKPFHDIRVRNYETDLSACRIPLADLLDPVGVAHVPAEVRDRHRRADCHHLARRDVRIRPTGPGFGQSATQTGRTGPARIRIRHRHL